MHKRKMFRKLLDLEKAISEFYRVYKATPLGVEEIDLIESVGRVLAEDIFSPMNVPPFDKSIVDGYAVIAEDTYPADETNPIELKVIERIRTGHPPRKIITRGTAAEIDTGAMVPRGATAIVPIEYTEEEGDIVRIYKKVAHGANIMFSGTDIGYGELVLNKGKILSFREIGVLSAIGMSKVKVYKKPRVAIFSIGDELIEPGGHLNTAKIYDVNSYLLYSAVKENFGDPILLGIAKDDADEVIGLIEKGLKKADLVISSGSTSAGTSDIVYRVIEEFKGPGIIAHGLKLAPGKPTVISVIEDKPYIGLPGNPTSALNVFQLIVAPLLWKLTGLKYSPQKSFLVGKTPYRLTGDVGRMVIQGVKVLKRGSEFHVYPIRSGSGAIRTLGDADGFVTIPPTRGFIDSGETININLLTELPPTDTVSIFAPPSPRLDKILAEAISYLNYDIKRLRASSTMALKTFMQGEADIAGIAAVNPMTGESNKFLLEKFNLDGKVEYIGLFSREIGIISRKDSSINSFRDILERGLLVVNYPPNTDGDYHVKRLLNLISRELEISLNEIIDQLKDRFYFTRDYYSAISAVLNSRADVAIVPRELVTSEQLSILILYNEEYGLIFSKEAREEVKETIKKITEANRR